VVEWVTPGSPAAEAGIQTGDIVRGFGDVSNPSWRPQIYEQIKLDPGQYVPVVVDRGGQTLTLSLHVPSVAKTEEFDIGDTACSRSTCRAHPGGAGAVGLPAQQAGLRVGDQIEAVDGHHFHSIDTCLPTCNGSRASP